MSSSRSRNAERVLETLDQYGTPLTAQEIHELLADIPLGTIHSTLHSLSKEDMVRVTNMGHKPRRYVANDNPQPVIVEQISTDPWQEVARKWFAVFGVLVSADDARLMAEIAYREVR